jgi:hypothetical protein
MANRLSGIPQYRERAALQSIKHRRWVPQMALHPAGDGTIADKLPMTAQAKSEAAWTITKENLGNLKAEQVRQLTGVSIRTVRSMRSVWRELNERGGSDRDGLMKLTWMHARELWEGKTGDIGDFDRDDWKHQKAQEVVDLIRRHNVASDHPELISELAERIANPPEDMDL